MLLGLVNKVILIIEVDVAHGLPDGLTGDALNHGALVALFKTGGHRYYLVLAHEPWLDYLNFGVVRDLWLLRWFKCLKLVGNLQGILSCLNRLLPIVNHPVCGARGWSTSGGLLVKLHLQVRLIQSG